MSGTVHLVNDASDVAAATRVGGKGFPHQLIALEYEAHAVLQDHKVPHVVSDDYLEDERFYDATKAGFYWARNWYDSGGIERLLQVDGVSLAFAAEHMLYYYFISVLRAVEIFLAILERERPDRVVLYVKPRSQPRVLLVQQEEVFFAEVFRYLAQLGRWRCPVDVVVGEAKESHSSGPERPWSVPIWAFAQRAGKLLVNRFPIHLARELSFTGRSAGKARIAFLAPDGGVNKFYAPLMAELRRCEKGELFFITEGTVARPGLGVRTLDVQRFVSEEDRMEIRSQLREAAALFLDRGELRDRFVYRDISLDGVMRDRFEYAFVSLFPSLATIVRGMGKICGEDLIDAVIAPNEIREFYRACFLVAERHRIPSLVLLHGIPTRKHPYFPGFEPRIVDHMAVWGEECRQILIDQGMDPRRLIVTGNSLFDSLPRRRSERERYRNLRKFGLLPGRKVVVFPSDRRNKGAQAYDITMSLREREALFLAVIKATNGIPEAQLAIKASPGDLDAMYIYELVRRHATNHTVVLEHVDLYDLLSIADVVVAIHTTVGLEALLSGALLVSVNLTGRPDRIDYAKRGVAIGVYEEAGLADALRRALFSAEVREELRRAIPDFLAAYAGPLDGRSAERVVALINRMTATHARRTQPPHEGLHFGEREG